MIDTKALREKVLDLAIRGKLVPQDPTDEPASVLLERIREQKKQMVKEGKLKAKNIKDDSVIFVGDDNLHYEKFADGSVKCIEDEIPFELPDGWAWSRLEPIASLITDYVANGSFASLKANVRTYKEKNYALFVRTVDFANNFKGDLSYIDKESYDFLEKSKLYGGELMLSNIGASIGKVFKVPHLDTPMSLAPNAIILRFFNDITCDYFEYVFKSFVGQDYLQFLSGGAAMPKFNKTDLRAMIVPVPPIKEQERIVESVKNIFIGIDDLDISYSGLANTIQSVKSKILDLAIRGKLVPQNPDDEPVSVLLERIRAEKEELIKAGKIKRDKKESVIFKGEDNSYYEKIGNGEVKCIDENIPFEIPESWCWCRLGTPFAHNTGKALNSADTAGTPMTYITTSNLYWDHFELNSLKEMPFTESEIEKCTVTKGDLLVCEGGDIGRSAIWMFDEDIRIQNHIHRLRPYTSLSNRFYYYVMFMWKQMGFIGGQGIGLQGFSSKALHNLLVPLPPEEEQIKIAAFVDNLFETITAIEKSLS